MSNSCSDALAPRSPDASKASTKREIRAAINTIGPLAKGALSLVRKTCGKPTCKACQSGEGHPAWIFTFRREGKASIWAFGRSSI